MSAFDKYHDLAACLLGREDFPLPLPEWDRNYPHNIGLLSDAEESELALKVLNHTRGMTLESWQQLDLEQRIPWMHLAVKQMGCGAKSRLGMSDILLLLSDRVQANMLILESDELVTWPPGIVAELVAGGVLRTTDNAKSISCDACDRDHVETVEYVESPPGSDLRAYIPCPENGRVSIALDRLRRWEIDPDKVSFCQDQADEKEGFRLPNNMTHKVTFSTVFLPTPAADDPKGLRDAAEYCRSQAAKLGDASAKWWWAQATVYDDSAVDAESQIAPDAKKETRPSFVDEPLNERSQNVLVAMFESAAFDSDHRQTTDEIAIMALGGGTDANALKSVMAELKTREYIQSKTGRGGGCWLTEKGRVRAEKLRNP